MRLKLATMVAAIIALVAAAVAPADATHARPQKRHDSYTGPLIDLQPDVDNATDGARAFGRLVTNKASTYSRYVIRGLPAETNGVEYASHLHDGTCDAVGGHYQDVIGGPVDAVNELWLPAIQKHRRLTSRSSVRWSVREGAPVVLVIHDPVNGAPAGCIPLTLA